ncbi:MAG: hypothetical protein M0042_07335 [Nitrospiraceae bacterium]|nr:hypothetical protein [Nitrospiraceae bacterium]
MLNLSDKNSGHKGAIIVRTHVTVLLSMLLMVISACSTEESGKTTQLPIQQNTAIKQDAEKMQKTSKMMTKETDSVSAKRMYKYPSMMIKKDMYHCLQDDNNDCVALLENLVVNKWRIIRDEHGRQCIYSSPEITYAELRDYLHFNDSDVTYLNDPKPGEPQAVIQTEWLTCNITFLHEMYDGKDASVKLRAELIDNEVMANSKKEESYHKNKGILRTILDWFNVVHT